MEQDWPNLNGKTHRTMKPNKKIGNNNAPSLHLVRYDNHSAQSSCIDLSDDNIIEKLPSLSEDKKLWLHFSGIKNPELLKKVLAPYQIHALVQEDILNNKQRPKIESYQQYVFIASRALRYDKAGLSGEAVYFIVGKNFVFSFQNRSNTLFDGIRTRILERIGQLPNKGSDFLAYALLDTVVDDYFVTMDTFAKKVEQLDKALFTGSGSQEEEHVLSRIHGLKHETTRLRRTIMPTREIINQLVRGDFDLFQEETRLYLRDVYDHTLQVMEVLDASREMILSMMDVYLSYQSNQLNKQMRILTVITIIFMPLTLISSIYGMNFTNMPELNWHYGYYAVLFIMVLIAGILLKFFTKQRWL